jgi:two-component system, cell cycle sensor histidine kinase and response regulator CckA
MQSELELKRLVEERTRELEAANEALRKSQQVLAREIDAAERLQQVATQLMTAQGTEVLYDQVLDTALAILRADFASIHIFYPERGTHGELQFLSHRGLNAQAARHWEWIRASTRTTCGEALRTRQRVAIPDIRNSDLMAGSGNVERYLGAGIRSIQTTPLISRTGALLGMVSTHWRERHDLSGGELRALDVLARLAADLIERSRAADALWRSEERFQQVAESADEFIWEVDADGLYLYASRPVEQILGYAPEEIVGRMHFYDLFVPDTREQVKDAAFAIFARRGRFQAFPNLNLRKDGKIVALETSGMPMLDRDGNFLGYRGTGANVTARREAEESLRSSEAQARACAAELQAILNAAPAAIFVAHDPECRRLSGNRAAYALLRQPPGASLSLPCSCSERPAAAGAPGGEIPPWQAPMREAASTGQPVRNCELQVAFEDGVSIDLLGNVEPLFDDRGRPRGAVGVLRDITEHKQTEAALRESEQRFRSLADTAPVMIWVCGPDKSATFFNKCCLDFSGRSLEEKLGEGWISGLHPEDRERFVGIYDSSIDARQEFRSVFRLRRADGEYRWVLCTGVPRFAPGDVYAGHIGSCIDITDQKLIQERLRASEARLMDAQRLAKVGSWERHLESDKIYWSDEMLRIFGLPAGALSNFPAFLNFVHHKDREKILGSDHQVRSSMSAVDVEYRIVRPDGEVRFLRSILEGIRNDQGAVVRIVGATRDITEQVQAQELLREREERLKNAERLAHIGSWHWDLKATRVSWSEEMFRIFAKPRDYIPGPEGFVEAAIPQDREAVERHLRDSISEKRGHSVEFQIVRPNGELRAILSTSEVLLDEEGVPAHIFGACQDVTDSKRAQEESLARQKLESVGMLARGIAHDFNNLLGAVLAQAELATAEIASGSFPKDELRGIREAAIRGSEIVRQLMIYAGKETAAVGLVDLSRIVNEMLALLRVSVSKRATLDVDLGKDLPSVRADAAQLRQVVMNLVTNASEAIGDRDGVIRVTTRCVKVGRDASGVMWERLPEGDYVRLEVSDTGSGMLMETQAKMFDPFFTTKSVGHGLGLAIVHGIVRDLGGAIHVASEPGKGTTFQILLPGAPGPTAVTIDHTNHTEELARPSQAASVLIVEDEDPLRQAVAKMLRKTGFEVFEAADGSSAIELLRANGDRIDVILLDLTIPGASSREVAAEALQARPGIKVILASAYSPEMVTPPMSPSEIRGFIRKPFQLGDLVQTLRNAVSGQARV